MADSIISDARARRDQAVVDAVDRPLGKRPLDPRQAIRDRALAIGFDAVGFVAPTLHRRRGNTSKPSWERVTTAR